MCVYYMYIPIYSKYTSCIDAACISVRVEAVWEGYALCSSIARTKLA